MTTAWVGRHRRSQHTYSYTFRGGRLLRVKTKSRHTVSTYLPPWYTSDPCTCILMRYEKINLLCYRCNLPFHTYFTVQWSFIWYFSDLYLGVTENQFQDNTGPTYSWIVQTKKDIKNWLRTCFQHTPQIPAPERCRGTAERYRTAWATLRQRPKGGAVRGGAETNAQNPGGSHGWKTGRTPTSWLLTSTCVCCR